MSQVRPSKDKYYLNIAAAVSERSTCIRRNYGAVIVSPDDIILGTGYNGSPAGEINCCDIGECIRNKLKIEHNTHCEVCEAVHAEQNAILRSLDISKLKGATLYLFGRDAETGEIIDAIPCPVCEKLIKAVGIKTVICSEK